MDTQVETYSGFRLHEHPRRFTWEGKWLEVAEVLARWRSPAHLGFKVKDLEGKVFLLLLDLSKERWEVQVY